MDKAEFAALAEEDKFRTLEGTAYFAHVQSPDMASAKRFNSQPTYHVSLGLDPAGVKLAKSYGLTVKEPNDYIPLPFVKIKRKVKDLTNPTASQPDVVDTQQNIVPTHILIGNGSKVAVKFATYWYDQFGGGIGSALLKMQVIDLVPYDASTAGGTDPDLTAEGKGWTVGADGETDATLFDRATA